MSDSSKVVWQLDQGHGSGPPSPSGAISIWREQFTQPPKLTGDHARRAAQAMAMGVPAALVEAAYTRKAREEAVEILSFVTKDTRMPLTADDIEAGLRQVGSLSSDYQGLLKKNIMHIVENRVPITDAEKLSDQELIDNMISIVYLANQMVKDREMDETGDLVRFGDSDLQFLKHYFHTIICKEYGKAEG